MERTIFSGIDFNKIAFNPDFKEDSVREFIILPLLEKLGYNQKSIVCTLKHPFIRIGSKKRPVTLRPDCILKVENNYE
ncbi:MAG: hypothetical protein LBN19_00365 [Endomicrobium sp.]|jgi:hypothetical protein|nr:hypothetical protein [Endomicrobium sp.]